MDIVLGEQAAKCSTRTREISSEYGIREIYSCSPRLLYIREFIQLALNDTIYTRRFKFYYTYESYFDYCLLKSYILQ